MKAASGHIDPGGDGLRKAAQAPGVSLRKPVSLTSGKMQLIWLGLAHLCSHLAPWSPRPVSVATYVTWMPFSAFYISSLIPYRGTKTMDLRSSTTV